MPNTTKTAAEIVSGALDLIKEHGFTIFGREGEKYSIPAAFDEVAFNDPNHTDSLIETDIYFGLNGMLLSYPPAYQDARVALRPHFRKLPVGVPTTQEEALAALQATLDDLNGGNAGVAAEVAA